MPKLNHKKEPMIEVLRIIEKKILEIMTSPLPSGTTIVNFSVYFYIEDSLRTMGDVYFEKIGQLK
jgi:hypothetical protein